MRARAHGRPEHARCRGALANRSLLDSPLLPCDVLSRKRGRKDRSRAWESQQETWKTTHNPLPNPRVADMPQAQDMILREEWARLARTETGVKT